MQATVKYEIQAAGYGRHKAWRVIGRDQNGTLRYRGFSVYNKRNALAVAESMNKEAR